MHVCILYYYMHTFAHTLNDTRIIISYDSYTEEYTGIIFFQPHLPPPQPPTAT